MPSRMKLTDINLLETLKSPEFARFLTKFRTRRFRKREIISLPGQERNFVFLVESGRVRVYLAYEDKEFTLTILEAGDIYSSHTRAFTQALEDSTLLVTDIRNFNEIIAGVPTFALTMVKVLGDLLGNSFSIIDGLAFKDVNLRLAEFLCHTAESKGVPLPEGIRLELGLNTEEIAMLLGTSRQTVSTLLSSFQRAGVLEKTGRGTILIKDLDGLRQLAADQ